jgi:hypothetical protein
MTVTADHLRLLSDRDRDRLEAAVEQFESAWERGETPQLDLFLTDEQDLRPALTVELVIADLEYRLRAGELVRADDYLNRYPELCDGPGAAAELQAAEDGRQGDRRATDTAVAGESIPPADGGPFPAVPGYELLGELGRGGMGIVYKARQVAVDRAVALKMIRTDGPADADLVARFRTEAEAAARLQHPHIVQIFEVGESGGRPFFAMELVESGTLADRLAAGPLLPADAAALLLPLARAVAAAHDRGVLHRDLKPANVLLQIADLKLQVDSHKSAI